MLSFLWHLSIVASLKHAFDPTRVVTSSKDVSCVYGEAKARTNSSNIKYLGSFSTWEGCKAAGLRDATGTALSWFDPKFNHADKDWSSGCYMRIDGHFPATRKDLVTSGTIMLPGAACNSDEGCSYNGVCTASGQCACDDAWEGKHCSKLALVPGERISGYRQINRPGMSNTSSWGGGSWWEPAEERWVMLVTELAENCGMHTWTTNSQTVRATSANATGLYERTGVVFPIWSHEVALTRAPSGEWISFFSYNAHPGASRQVCHACKDGSTPKACKSMSSTAVPDVFIENTDPTYMSWAANGSAPWSHPVRVTNWPNVQMDTNMAAVVLANGSLVGMWRDHHPGGHHSTPHLVTAEDWRDPTSYVFHDEDLLFGRMDDNPGAVEDMMLYVDARGHFHALFHQMYDCETCTAHASSADGLSWQYTGTAADGTAHYSDGTQQTFSHVERPHMIFDKDGVTPVALTNGVKIQGISDDDLSFTLLRPLRRKSNK